MDLLMTKVPAWVSILFILTFSTIPLLLIANTIKTTYSKNNIEDDLQLRNRILIFYWSYLGIVALISLTGFFIKNVLPPRIILFSTIPLFIFYLFYVQKRPWFITFFKYVTLKQLIYIHLFRFVGVFFFLSYAYNAIPKTFAFIGGTGDILTAVLVIPLAIALRKKITFVKPLIFIWNIIGLLDITLVLITAVIITQQAIKNNYAGVEQFGTFPFSWIPAFAPATIIFLHILIFRKLKDYK